MEIALKLATWNSEEYVLPDAQQLLAYPQTLGSLQRYVYAACGSLVTYESYGASLSEIRRRLAHSRWIYGSEDYWSYQFAGLLWQASELGIADPRLREAESLATVDVFRACEMLVRDLYRRVVESLASLRSGFLLAIILASVCIIRYSATAHVFRNNITLQRRFFLTHGSHPIEESVTPLSRLRPGGRGCAPVFQR
jgi:hypothetical protein